MPYLAKQVNEHALRHCSASSKTTNKIVQRFSQYPLRVEKQVTSKLWSLSGGSFATRIPSRITFSIMAINMCVKCPSNISKSGLSLTYCPSKSNHTANILIVVQLLSETSKNELSKVFDSFHVFWKFFSSKNYQGIKNTSSCFSHN